MSDKSKALVVTSVDGLTGEDLVGKHVLLAAKQTGSFQRLYGLAQNLEAASELSGVDVCKVGEDILSSCQESFSNSCCVVLIPPASEHKLEITKKYLEACKKYQVKHVVLVSMYRGKKEPTDCKAMEEFRRVEQMLTDSGIQDYCILRLAFYAENLLLYKDQMKEGVFPVPLPNQVKLAPISLADAGECIVKICHNCATSSVKHVSETYNITGPESLSGEEMAKVASEALGQTIKFQCISDADARKILTDAGLDPTEVEVVIESYEITRRGDMEGTTEDAKKLLGRQAHSLKSFFNLKKAALIA